MNATKSRKPARKPARPVTEVLLELAYHLHASRVIRHPDSPPAVKSRSLTPSRA